MSTLTISLIIGILCSAIVLVLMNEERSLLEKRFKDSKPKDDGLLKSVSGGLDEVIRPFSLKNSRAPGYINKTRKLLLQAGEAATEEDVINFDTIRIKNLIVAIIICVVVLFIDCEMWTLIACPIFLILIYKRNEFRLMRQVKIRKKEFMRYLPDAVDLLSICVQAGLSLDASFAKVSEEFSLTSKTVSVEFERLNKDILSGLNRQESYKNLVLRNENPDLQSFVALLIQTDKLGTSITQSLYSFCDSLRTKKRQRIEELSAQASTKMTIPMVLFLLPSIFIIIMYPALQKISQNLGGM